MHRETPQAINLSKWLQHRFKDGAFAVVRAPKLYLEGWTINVEGSRGTGSLVVLPGGGREDGLKGRVRKHLEEESQYYAILRLSGNAPHLYNTRIWDSITGRVKLFPVKPLDYDRIEASISYLIPNLGDIIRITTYPDRPSIPTGWAGLPVYMPQKALREVEDEYDALPQEARALLDEYGRLVKGRAIGLISAVLPNLSAEENAKRSDELEVAIFNAGCQYVPLVPVGETLPEVYLVLSEPSPNFRAILNEWANRFEQNSFVWWSTSDSSASVLMRAGLEEEFVASGKEWLPKFHPVRLVDYASKVGREVEVSLHWPNLLGRGR